MRDTASKTLVTVHQQGQQIHRTHMMAVDIDQDLSRVTTAFSNFSC
jgi:synaptosomal-associated protein 25